MMRQVQIHVTWQTFFLLTSPLWVLFSYLVNLFTNLSQAPSSLPTPTLPTPILLFSWYFRLLPIPNPPSAIPQSPPSNSYFPMFYLTCLHLIVLLLFVSTFEQYYQDSSFILWCQEGHCLLLFSCYIIGYCIWQEMLWDCLNSQYGTSFCIFIFKALGCLREKVLPRSLHGGNNPVLL